MNASRLRTTFAITVGLLALTATLLLLGLLGKEPPAQAAASPRPAQAAGDVFCVTLDGDEHYLGCTQVFTNVQAAVDAVVDGDIIKVAMGVYTDVQNRLPPLGYNGPAVITQIVYLSKTVTLQGGYSTSNWTTPYPLTQPTTLDAQGQGRVVYITGDISPTLEGLRMTGGDATGLGGLPSEDAGGGIYIITASVTLRNSQVFSNSASNSGIRGSGGGIYSFGPLALFETEVLSNAAGHGHPGGPRGGPGGDGGGIYSIGELLLTNSLARNNTAGVGGSTLITPGYAGDGGSGGGIYSIGTLELCHSAVMDNRGGDGGDSRGAYTDFARYARGGKGGDGGGIYTVGTLTLTANVIVSNTAGRGGDAREAYGEGGNGGNGGGIYVSGTLTSLNTTFKHNVAGTGGSATSYPDYWLPREGGDGGSGGGIYGTGAVQMEWGDISDNHAGNGGDGRNILGMGGSGGSGGSGGGLYVMGTLTLNTSTANDNTAGEGGGGGNDCAGGSGGGIYIQGTLELTQTTANHNSTGRGGGSSPYSSGCPGGSGGGVCSGGAARLVYVTVSENTAGDGGSAFGDWPDGGYGGSGGGIASSGTLELDHSSVMSNTAGSGGNSSSVDIAEGVGGNGGSGGGIESFGTIILKDSLLSNNISGNGGWATGRGYGGPGGSGGGLYAVCALLTLADSVITRNGSGTSPVTSTHGNGGGIALNCNAATLTNVVVADNYSSSSGGGMYNYSSNSTLVNSILWGDSPDEIYNNASATAITYSDVQGGYAGTGNLNANPQFVAPIMATAAPTTTGNYRVHYNSPAIDAGNTLSVTSATDLDGHPRVMGKAVDMGAYEVGFVVTKQADPDPVQAGAQLTYTINLANYYADDLHSIITDTLPAHVIPGDALTWTRVISASSTWMQTIVVTVAQDNQNGPLVNRVQVTTQEGPAGIAIAVTNSYKLYLPIVLR